MEKNYKEDLSRDDTIRLTIKSLLEVVQTGAKNIEITVMESYGKKTVSCHVGVTLHSQYLLTRYSPHHRSSRMRRSRRSSNRSRLKRRPRPSANVLELQPSLNPLLASVGTLR